MIEIDPTMLSEDALDNLIIDIITRQGTDYGECEIDFEVKKKQLKNNLYSGDAVIVFSPTEDACDIIRIEEFKAFQSKSNTKIEDQ